MANEMTDVEIKKEEERLAELAKKDKREEAEEKELVNGDDPFGRGRAFLEFKGRFIIGERYSDLDMGQLGVEYLNIIISGYQWPLGYNQIGLLMIAQARERAHGDFVNILARLEAIGHTTQTHDAC